MDFFSENFIKSHINKIINFYFPRCIDKTYGGYINQLFDNGDIADYDTKHLVGTCRFIYNFSTCYNLFSESEYLDAARHGIDFLYNNHRRKDGSYSWVMKKDGSYEKKPQNSSIKKSQIDFSSIRINY